MQCSQRLMARRKGLCSVHSSAPACMLQGTGSAMWPPLQGRGGLSMHMHCAKVCHKLLVSHRQPSAKLLQVTNVV